MNITTIKRICIIFIGLYAHSMHCSYSAQAIILAAGKSSRFGTEKSKLLHTLCGKEMILYPVHMFHILGIPTTLVIGHQADAVKKTVLEKYPDTTFVMQQKQLGTGHALMCTQDMWNMHSLIVLNGDMPLVDSALIKQLLERHQTENSALTFAVSTTQDQGAQGFGRVIEKDGLLKIVEVKHLEGNPENFPVVNVGIYILATHYLPIAISLLHKHTATEEFYITDLIEIMQTLGHKVHMVPVPFDKVRGINTIEEFSVAQTIKRQDLVRFWMQQGVLFTHPETVELDDTISIGAGTVIGQGVHITNQSTIGINCTIEPFTLLNNAHIHDNTIIPSHSRMVHNK